MKQLVIIRHAKAESLQPGCTDFDRNLCDRGQSDAVRIANQLFDSGITPQAVVCSSAKRTIQTAELFATQYGIEHLIKKDMLYGDYGISDIQQLLSDEAPDADTVFLIGHNPNLSYLLSRLTEDFYQHLSTSSVAVLEFNISQWNELRKSHGQLRQFLSPKEA